MRNQTVEFASTLPAPPVKVGVVSVVILSLLLVPVSLPASRSGAAAGALAVKSSVMVKSAEFNESLLAVSVIIGKKLADMGFQLVATGGTARRIAETGTPVESIPKLAEGRPNIADLITNADVDLIINTPTRRGPTTDEGRIRALATLHQLPLITTITGAEAAVAAIAALCGDGETWTVRPLQEYIPQTIREA